MRKYILIALLSLLACFAVGCSGGSNGSGSVTSNKIEEIVWNEYNTVLMVGETKQLSAQGKELKWNSTNSEIVSVSSTGLITALKIGNVQVTVSNGSQTKGIEVYVVDAGIPKIVVDSTDKYVKVGGQYKIEYSFTLNGQPFENAVTFESSDTAVATVNETGVVTGVAVGETTVKIKYTVSIKGQDYDFSQDVKISVNENGLFTLDQTQVRLVVKKLNGKYEQSQQINVHQKVFEGAENAQILWTTANADVATVSQDGVINAVSAGETVITATVKDNEGYSAKVNVTVGKEEVYLNNFCYADLTTEIGTSTLTEWAKLNIYDDNFYGDILSVKKSDGDIIAHEGLKLKSDALNVGNNELIIDTNDFTYYATVKSGFSYYNFPSYDIYPWEYGNGTFNVLETFGDRTNVLEAISSKPEEGEVLDDVAAELKYHDIYNNNVGIWNLSASNLFGNSGYLTFDLFVEENSITNVGFYLIYQGEGKTVNNAIRFRPSENKFSFSKNGDGYGEFNGFVRVVDSELKETAFVRGKWNKILINCGSVDLGTYDSIKLVISFENNVYKDGEQKAYYSNFAFMSEEQYFEITGEKTVCEIEKAILAFNGTQNGYDFIVNGSTIAKQGLNQIKYADVKVNEGNSNSCTIAGVRKGQVLDLVIETDFKIYKVKALVTVLATDEDDNIIFDTDWD